MWGKGIRDGKNVNLKMNVNAAGQNRAGLSGLDWTGLTTEHGAERARRRGKEACGDGMA